MPSRRFVLIAAACLAAPLAAHAAGVMRFASVNFAAALEKGGPVLVHIDATWCPTCRAQKPILDRLLAQPKYAAVTAFSVDYDSEKPVMRELSAPERSTILVFAKGKEVARSTGDTSESAIAALIDKSL
ncbi:thioredoxin family protein [Chelatococcus sambhunathii]|uniref:Thioredoxin family protein n=1 Tax=Chelatococcus sambhunathii TaxID=363953 RepID=A0ABU1DED7_9HYPH|nr:thioredoxin family protein [Chelatococcus sambhunathii]MDR4306491.1 thioredoxin family protein [Chelatococcus sambhunathii]